MRESIDIVFELIAGSASLLILMYIAFLFGLVAARARQRYAEQKKQETAERQAECLAEHIVLGIYRQAQRSKAHHNDSIEERALADGTTYHVFKESES